MRRPRRLHTLSVFFRLHDFDAIHRSFPITPPITPLQGHKLTQRFTRQLLWKTYRGKSTSVKKNLDRPFLISSVTTVNWKAVNSHPALSRRFPESALGSRKKQLNLDPWTDHLFVISRKTCSEPWLISGSILGNKQSACKLWVFVPA